MVQFEITKIVNVNVTSVNLTELPFLKYQKQPFAGALKNAVLENFAKFKGKH